MAIIRWNPYREVDTFENEIERLFNESLEESLGLSSLPTLREISETSLLTQAVPRVDIFEDKDNYVVTAELPGLKREEVEVKLEDSTLSIKGERKLENEDKKKGYHLLERYYGAFSRSFTIPSTIDASKVEAKMESGVLKVVLPKKEESRPKQIEVKVN